MNIYKISQTQNQGYDTYASAVVIAKDEQEARHIYPADYVTDFEWWKKYDQRGCWTAPTNINVELIGIADETFDKPQIICASFNAG